MHPSYLFFIVLVVSAFFMFASGNVMRDTLTGNDQVEFRKDTWVYWAVMVALAILHQVVYSAYLVTTPVTQWGFSVTLTALVLLFNGLRFMNYYDAMKQHLTNKA